MKGRTLLPLSSVLRCLVSSLEKSLGSAASLNGSALGARAALQRALFQARIAAAKALVIIRWSKTMNVSESIKDVFSSPEIKIHALLSEIDEIRGKMKIGGFQMPAMIPDSEYVRVPRVRARDAFVRLLLLGVPKRMKLVGHCGRVIRFCAPGEYQLSLYADSSGAFHLRSFSVVWPKDFEVPRGMIARMVVLLRKHERPARLMLYAFDRILHNFYIDGRYVFYALRIKEKCPSYNAQVRRSRHPFSVVIEFPRPSGKEKVFYLSIESGRLCFSAHSCIYLPEEFTNLLDMKSWLLFEQFNRYSSSGKNCLEFRSHLMMFLMTLPAESMDELLCFLRDAVCYSVWWVINQTLVHSVRALALPYITVKTKLRGECVTHGYMSAIIGRQRLIVVRLDAFSGLVKVSFQPKLLSVQDANSIVIRTLLDIYRTLTLSLTNVALSMTANAIYGTSVSHFSMFEDTVHYAHVFSFAPDFAVHVNAHGGHPRISIVDSAGNLYSKPEIVRMQSTTANRAWGLFPAALVVAKRHIFLAQIQRYLTELQVHSVLIGDCLECEVTRRCRVRVSEKGWSVGFIPFPSIVPKEAEEILKIRGRFFTTRCSKLIATIIHNFQLWRNVQLHVSKLQMLTCTVRSVVKTDSCQISIGLANSNQDSVLLSFARNAKLLGTKNGAMILEATDNFDPYLRGTCAKTVPLSDYFNRVLRQNARAQEFFAFLSCSCIPILEFYKLFTHPGSEWIVTDLAPNFFGLIYKGCISLSGRLANYRWFDFYVPNLEPSNLLFVFLGNIVQRGPPSRMAILISVDKLGEFKRTVELQWSIYESFITEGFRSELSSDQLKLILTHTIGRTPITVTMQSPNLTINVRDRTDINTALSNLMEGNHERISFLRAVLAMIKVTLSIDIELLHLILTILTQFRSDFSFDGETLEVIMFTVCFDSASRHALMEFPYNGSMYCIECMAPFHRSTRIILKRDLTADPVDGVDGLMSALSPLTTGLADLF